MPNWCEGTLKIRGQKEDIINFLENGIVPVSPWGEEKKTEIEHDQYWLIVKSNESCFYLKGTTRGFIEENEIWFDYEDSILAVEYKQAWGIDTSQLVKISKQYNLDLKIYAYEKGMEFNQSIEIHKGEIIKDEEIKFKDYKWECTNPNIGG